MLLKLNIRALYGVFRYHSVKQQLDSDAQTVQLGLAEIVRAMTFVINQGMAMYWGTSRWSAMEIMVRSLFITVSIFVTITTPIGLSVSITVTITISISITITISSRMCACVTEGDVCRVPHSLYHLSFPAAHQEAYSVARQFNLIPPVCEQAEYHYFQRDKVEVQLPELYHKIGESPRSFHSSLAVSYSLLISRSTHLIFIWLHPNAPPRRSTVTGVGAMTWSPLACGLITGKYSDGVPECSRAAMKVSLIGAALLGGIPLAEHQPSVILSPISGAAAV